MPQEQCNHAKISFQSINSSSGYGKHYPHYYQILAYPDLRQELTEYVLERVRSLQINLQMRENSQTHTEMVPCLTEIKLQIEDFINQGICHLLF
jgi:hypothetical protein